MSFLSPRESERVIACFVERLTTVQYQFQGLVIIYILHIDCSDTIHKSSFKVFCFSILLSLNDRCELMSIPFIYRHAMSEIHMPALFVNNYLWNRIEIHIPWYYKTNIPCKVFAPNYLQ